MKNLLPLALLAAAFLVGCSADKSSDVQTNVAPNGGKAYGSAPAAGSNPNIPAAAKVAVPGAGK